MPFTLKMPKLSPTMEEGTIVKWHVAQGSLVKEGTLLLEVATDKATVEYQALDGGWLRHILVQQDQDAKVGGVIAILSENEHDSIDELLTQCQKKADVIEVKNETSTALPSSSLPSSSSSAQVMGSPSFIPEEPLKDAEFIFYQEWRERIKASPLAKKIAQEKKLDLTTVKGSGPDGRIIEADLVYAQPLTQVGFTSYRKPEKESGSYTQQPMTPMRKKIASRLQEAKTFIPHFYVTQEIDVMNLVEIREQLKSWEIKVTMNDFIVRACALALRQHPVINSSYHTQQQAIVHYETIDIAIAVSVDGGLITPIVRWADHKNLGQLSVEIKELSKKAREGKLAPHEYKGGSFTISNLGMFDVEEFQAIINPPQGAILAVGGIKDVPVVKQGEIVPGKRMKVSLSSDHRVIDGVAAAQFLLTLKKYLENPAGLCLQ